MTRVRFLGWLIPRFVIHLVATALVVGYILYLFGVL